MADSPFSVFRLLRQHLLDAAKPAYLVTSNNLKLVTASGDLKFYGLSGLVKGESCESRLDFLIGYDVSEPLELRFYQATDEVFAHVVLLPHEGSLIILFMDATEAYQQEVKVQQKTNDLLILSEKQDVIVKELVKARDSIANKHEALVEANQAKAKFIATISEELKSPLTSILGHASLLKNVLEDSPSNLKMIEAIERGGRHLLTVVENSLDQMNIELDYMKLKVGPVDINDLLQDLESVFLPLAKRKKLKFSVVTESLPPHKIKIDEIRLRQVLVNLLNNSIKYTDMGSIKLTSRWEDNLLKLDVYDTGRGIPESFQKDMFTAFTAGRVKTGTAQGKGLGLSIAKRLIDLMDGEIRCESVQGAETCFKLRIPAELVASDKFSTTIVDDLEFGENAHILVLDSSEDLCQLYDLALSKAGFVASTFSEAKEGVKFATEKEPSLILVSLNSLDDCLNTTRQLRAAGNGQAILVMLSLESSASSRSVFEAGGNGFLTKPINIIDLIETVKAYVSPNQTDDSDVTMRTYLRQRFNEYLSLKIKYFLDTSMQLSSSTFDIEAYQLLENELRQLLLTAEMYGYNAITNAAKVTENILKNRAEYDVDELLNKLLNGLKMLNAEIQFILES